MFGKAGILALVCALSGCVGAAYISDTVVTADGLQPGTRDEVIAAHGLPYKQTDGELVYKLEQSRMHGIALGLVIPLPLYMPAGKEQLVFHLEGDRVANVTRLTSRQRGGFCGVVPDKETHIEFKFGCISLP